MCAPVPDAGGGPGQYRGDALSCGVGLYYWVASGRRCGAGQLGTGRLQKAEDSPRLWQAGAVSAAYEALWLGSVGWAGWQIISAILLLGFIWWCIMNL